VSAVFKSAACNTSTCTMNDGLKRDVKLFDEKATYSIGLLW